MVKKLNDIRSRKNTQKPKPIWYRPSSKHDYRLLPLIFIALIIVFITHTFFITIEANTLKNDLIAYSESGFSKLEAAKASIYKANWNEAKESFTLAEEDFQNLSKQAKLIKGTVLSPSLLSDAGENLSKTGFLLSEVADTLTNLVPYALDQNKILQDNPDLDIYQNSITKPIEKVVPKIQEATQYLDESIVNLQNINQDLLPKELIETFNHGLETLELVSQKLHTTQNYLPILLDLLGAKTPHNYLILVQNSNEIRPSGGFIGNLIFVEIKQGYLTQLESHSIYDFDGQLTDTLAVPPEFQGFVEEIFARDANFSPDYQTSALKVEMLLQRAKTKSFDTIIALDNFLLEDLLNLTGPLKLDSYPFANIDSSNFDIILNYLEQTDSQSKNINSEFIAKFKEKFLEVPNAKDLGPLFLDNINQKHLQFFSKHSNIQNIFNQFNFTPTVPSKAYDVKQNHDYLLISTTSIGGNKTDKFTKQRYIHTTNILSNGEIHDNLTIRKFHGFSESQIQVWRRMLQPFGVTILDPAMLNILGRGDNISRIKVYVPKGSKLINTKNIDFNLVKKIYDPEVGLDYFLLEIRLKPQETKEISIDYTLPFKLKPKPVALYKLALQTQAGAKNITFEKQYNFSSDFIIKNYYPDNYSLNQTGQYHSEIDLRDDLELAVIFSK